MFTLDQAGRRSHEVRIVPPPEALGAWVEHLVVDRRPGTERGPWRIVPDASAHLVVTFGPGREGSASEPRRGSELRRTWDARRPLRGPSNAGRPFSRAVLREGDGLLGSLLRAVVVGGRTGFVDADVTGRGTTVGARFRPGGLAGLMGERAGAMTDRGVDLATALGRPGREAVEQLGDARTAPEAIDVLARLVAELAGGRRGPDWRVAAVERALRSGGGGVGPGALAEATGMAGRTLRAVTAENVGITPRRWVRIHRLFRALGMAAARPAPSWTWIAARAGFHDPPHLTREFRAVLGETPTAWRRRALP